MQFIEALKMLGEELQSAERKFPGFPTDPIHAAAILQEEAGELVQSALQYTYEGGCLGAMQKEAVQVGAMALRFLLNFDSIKSRPSEQVERVPNGTQHAK
jgi:hypothetical protein